MIKSLLFFSKRIKVFLLDKKVIMFKWNYLKSTLNFYTIYKKINMLLTFAVSGLIILKMINNLDKKSGQIEKFV